MPSYRIPIVIRGFALIRYPNGKGAGDYVGGLPRDAEAEVRATPPYFGGVRMMNDSVELSGPAQLVEPR